MEYRPYIVVANAKIVRGLEDPAGVLSMLETIGRVSHASAPSKDANSAEKFVRMLIRLGHESVLEHVSVTVLVECDRAMAQQWTRHRMAAYTMESQRYVSYKELKFVDPEFGSKTQPGAHFTKVMADRIADGCAVHAVPEDVKAVYVAFEQLCTAAQHEYQMMRNSGVPPEDARAVLPNSTRTVFYTTANLRNWRHVFETRCVPAAQHNIRRVMMDLLRQFNALLPAVFGDLMDKLDV